MGLDSVDATVFVRLEYVLSFVFVRRFYAGTRTQTLLVSVKVFRVWVLVV